MMDSFFDVSVCIREGDTVNDSPASSGAGKKAGLVVIVFAVFDAIVLLCPIAFPLV